MRVLHVITRLIRGGAQENTLRTAVLHQAHGVDSEIVHGPTDPEREGELLGQAAAAGIRLHLVPSLRRAPAAANDLKALLAIHALLRRSRYDLVHTHTSKAGFLGRLAARLAAVPAVVHTPHGHVFHSYYGPLTTRLYVRLERVAARWADALVALTPRERDEHLDYGIGEPRSWTIVPSGIEVERFRRSPERRREVRAALGLADSDPVLGCVGRLAPVKGQQALVRALPALRSRHPALRLILAGDGEERERLVALARELGVTEGLLLLGHVADPAPLYSALDVLAVPSLNEGMGRVILEAMAAEVPVVASAVGGIPDLIDPRRTGWLVPPGEPDRLAGAILEVLARPEQARRFTTAARAAVGPGYGQDAMAAQLLALYRRLAGVT